MENKVKIKVAAVIPVQQYGNIQPEIEIETVADEYLSELGAGLKLMENLFSEYSEKGGLKKQDAISYNVAEEKVSFNEGIKVFFEPIEHKYKTADGKELISATTYIKKFFKEFNTDSVSKSCAKAWNVEPEEVSSLWADNGKITSEFGSAVHLALELYEKNKAIGERIQKTKKDQEENYAMPKHPIIRKIIEGFIEVNKTSGEVIPEALITNLELGLCGHADRVLILDRKKKICRIQDYKINIGSEEIKKENQASEPFEKLPANKITKYQLQLSLYANMLQKSGWKVTGLDVFVLEDGWKHYDLEVLNVI